MSAASTSYDALPYEGGAIPLTHPLRLAAAAGLQGLATAPVATGRVLEIGCGDGFNLLPLAACYPEATFHGLDLSQRHITAAQAVAHEVGLTNVTFTRCDVLEFQPAGRHYDYIIAHGIFSWVPETVRHRILRVIAEGLSDAGIATVSYNTFPGWRLRGALRDLLRFHTEATPSSLEKVQRGRELLTALSQSVIPGTAYGTYLKHEIQEATARSDSYLLHEFIEGENQPFSLPEFVAVAENEGLAYVGDADPRVTAGGNLRPDVSEALKQVTRDPIAFAQYVDFITVGSFRRSLLVRKGRRPDPVPDHDGVRRGWFSSPFQPESAAPQIKPGARERFHGRAGTSFETDHALVKAVVVQLSQVSPADLSHSALVESVGSRLSPFEVNLNTPAESGGPPDRALIRPLIELVNRGLVEFTLEPLPAVGNQRGRPRVSALTRYEAKHRSTVTNRRHVGVKVAALIRWLMVRLDGTRSRENLEHEYCQAAESGILAVTVGGRVVTDPAALRAVASEHVGLGLGRLEASAYLLPG
ncbi:MAG: class I SAM-dependent methyltransferase [Opitutaceae bacterium]|nr:class I SAM-dependent methyltransferase [Opitutaceae bacterium]